MLASFPMEKQLLEKISKAAQKVFSSNPVVIMGSGASYPHGLPSMGDLQAHLIGQVQPQGTEEEDAWRLVRSALEAGDHLEQAMSGKSLPDSLVEKIVRETWVRVNNADRAVYAKVLRGQERFAAGSLFKSLFGSSNTTINVVTTNYDRVAEYACNSADLLYSCGFTPGYLQRREGIDQLKMFRGNQMARTVRIWKVHGSLDWFEQSNGTPFAAPLHELPEKPMNPLIVTPGVSKYQRTHDEPFRSAIQGADYSLEHASGYLCVGFGFRDFHIEPKLVERCRQSNVPIAVLARTLTDEARAFLKQKAGTAYLALEKSAEGTKAYTAEYPEGVEVPTSDLWCLDGYLTLVT